MFCEAADLEVRKNVPHETRIVLSVPGDGGAKIDFMFPEVFHTVISTGMHLRYPRVRTYSAFMHNTHSDTFGFLLEARKVFRDSRGYQPHTIYIAKEAFSMALSTN